MKSQNPRSSCERNAVSVTQAMNGACSGVASTMLRVSVAMRLLLSPTDLEHADRVLEAAQGVLAAVGEQEPLARAQLSHGHRRQDLAALGLGCDARGEDDGRAEQVAAPVRALLLDGLARIESDAHAER